MRNPERRNSRKVDSEVFHAIGEVAFFAGPTSFILPFSSFLCIVLAILAEVFRSGASDRDDFDTRLKTRLSVCFAIPLSGVWILLNVFQLNLTIPYSFEISFVVSVIASIVFIWVTVHSYRSKKKSAFERELDRLLFDVLSGREKHFRDMTELEIENIGRDALRKLER